MRKIKVVLLTGCLFLILNINNSLAQSTDTVELTKPSEGTTINEVFSIEWKMIDTDIENPAYFIDVFNLSCTQSGGNVGRITNSGAENQNGVYKYNWDVKSSNLANSLQDGGNYCMRVCGILADGGSVYSKCDKKSFTYSGNATSSNKLPQITPAKEGFKVSINQVFNYKVEASDPDGDEIKFSLLSAPDFLKINETTGEISGKPTEVGDVRFIVKAEDTKGGFDTEEFVLTIQIANATKELEFEFPKANSVVTPDNNTLKWKINQGIILKTLTLSYSRDNKDWTEITKIDRNLSEYKWNISEIDEGDYFIRAQLVDSNNKLYEILSDKFAINSQVDISSTQISNISPNEGSEISESRPKIEAIFLTPEGVSIETDKVVFKLNDRIDLTLCDITETKISCEVVSELLPGSYTVYIEIIDSEGVTVVKEWEFNVNTSLNQDGEENESSAVTTNTVQIIIAIIVIGFLLIAIPWSIYLIIKKKRNKKEEIVPILESPVIHPISPLTQEQTQPSQITQPIIGTQGIDVQPISNQTEYPIPQIPNQPAPISEMIPQQPMVENNLSQPNPQKPVEEPFNSYTAPDEAIKNDTSSTTSANVVPKIDQPNNSVNLYPINTGSVNESDPNLNPVSPEVISDNVSSIVTNPQPVQPAMYQQDEIPEWLEKDLPDNTNPDTPQTVSTLEDVVTKTEIQDGAKVYDPYGLALNTDETEQTATSN